jgi:hypothetical protein
MVRIKLIACLQLWICLWIRRFATVRESVMDESADSSEGRCGMEKFAFLLNSNRGLLGVRSSSTSIVA